MTTTIRPLTRSEFARKMKIARQVRGLTTTRLAELAQCSIAMISLMESGKREGRYEMRARIAKVLGFQPYVLEWKVSV